MAIPNEMFDYLSAADEAYAANVRQSRHIEDVTLLDVELTSQVWQGTRWTHRLQLFIPDTLTTSRLALIYVLDSRPEMEVELGRLFALESGIPCVFLYDIPNQPLFGDLVEDALIAHTFVRYLDTADPTWPLLFPMVKSVCRAMDATQELAEQHSFSAERFVITGASKRGWTTWLTAAADPRVAAIVPMVYDNLNIAAQLPHQLAAAGSYSDQISDYTEAGLPERMSSPEGRRLMQLVDPYTYRDALTLPKLIINGANDPYWMTDALNLYWDDLPGRKHVLYIPNVGHSLRDYERLYGVIRAFTRLQAADASFPRLSWSFTFAYHELKVELDVSEDTTGARCWTATAPGHDFREAEWQSTAMKLTHGARSTRHWHIAIPNLDGARMAAFAEVDLEQDGQPYRLSTQMFITP